MKCIVCESEMEYMGRKDTWGGTDNYLCLNCLTRYKEHRDGTQWTDMYGTVFDDPEYSTEFKEKRAVIKDIESRWKMARFRFSFSKLCKISHMLRELEF